MSTSRAMSKEERHSEAVVLVLVLIDIAVRVESYEAIRKKYYWDQPCREGVCRSTLSSIQDALHLHYQSTDLLFWAFRVRVPLPLPGCIDSSAREAQKGLVITNRLAHVCSFWGQWIIFGKLQLLHDGIEVSLKVRSFTARRLATFIVAHIKRLRTPMINNEEIYKYVV